MQPVSTQSEEKPRERRRARCDLGHVFFEHVFVAWAACWVHPQRKHESESTQVRFAQTPEAGFVLVPFVAVHEKLSQQPKENMGLRSRQT